MSEEFWKIVPNAPMYSASTLGSVRNNESGEMLNPSITRKGYLSIYLCINGVFRSIHLHRITALTFIPNPENKPQVNHINGIKTDNRVENLEWCSSLENTTHAIRIGLRETYMHRGTKTHFSKLKEEDVKVVIALIDKGNTYAEIGRQYNVDDCTIKKIDVGETWSWLTGRSKKFRKNAKYRTGTRLG